MTGRAFLNVIEADLLSGLDGEARAQMHWSIHDPAGWAADRARQTTDVLLAAGGEL